MSKSFDQFNPPPSAPSPEDTTMEIEPGVYVEYVNAILDEAKKKGLKINKMQGVPRVTSDTDPTEKEHTFESLEASIAELRARADESSFSLESLDMFIDSILPTVINNIDTKNSNDEVKKFLADLQGALKNEIRGKVAKRAKSTGSPTLRITRVKFK